ncbi:MAG: thioredoxin family protein [Desulfobulbus sp.]|nr:MAG: thioredoxin family protein [Desulfobulbus sp.]RUM39519.1 MAG: thioredoxin family protein [Desulfobulbus sp.]
MDAATSRTIRIGTAHIGLVGLDTAINEAAARNLSQAEAMDFLYRAIREKNYIPSGMVEKYRIALFNEYTKHLNNDKINDEGLVLRIFGPGCVSCNGLQNLAIEVLAEMNIAADIEQIHDPDEIGRAGVLQTPALMINGQLKSSGLLPTRALLEQWIREVSG